MEDLYKKHINVVLKEMCSRVGANFDNMDFSDKPEIPYYQLYEWSGEEEKKFSDWLADYVYKNPEARKTLAEYPTLIRTKKGSKKFADFFIAVHGWKTKLE
jgi:hypothetical protein